MLDDSQIAAALGRLRTLSGLSQRAAARSIGVRLTVLRSWEARQSSPTRSQLATAIAVYGHDVEQLLSTRTDLDSPSSPGMLQVGSTLIDTLEIRANFETSSDANARILSEYLAAVRQERGTKTLEAVELRSVDLARLADVLDISDSQLGDILADQLNLTPAGGLLATRAVLVAALMGVAAITTIGTGSVVNRSNASASAASKLGDPAAQVEVVGIPLTELDHADAPPWVNRTVDAADGSAAASTDLVPLAPPTISTPAHQSIAQEDNFSVVEQSGPTELPDLFATDARSKVASASEDNIFIFSTWPRGWTSS
ncbi:MAG: helix-turn-helix transcriptional regulator [Microthrixaceae bacterium]|nr:helix-turn-helix transcriptional regulator [Microthrixaceae bacterium]